MSKKPYRVYWSKAYYTNGEVLIYADSPEEADAIAYDNMGDLSGSLDYCPVEDVIDVQDMDEDEVKEYTGHILNA